MDNEQVKLGHCDEFSPDRCQSVTKNGQCRYHAYPGSKFCLCHGGNKGAQATELKNVFKYRLAKYQERLDAHSDASEIKNLRSEIAILRFLVQARLNECREDTDLAMHSSVIARLVDTIQSLSITCAKVECTLTDIIDKQNAVALATSLLDCSRKYLTTEDFRDLSDDITDTLDRLHTASKGTFASQYKIAAWQSQIDSFMTTDRLVSLRGEIGVMRVIIEDQLNACTDNYALLTQSSVICGHIQKVEKLVASCHKLEQSTGLLLDKEAALQLCQELIRLVGNYVEADDLNRVATDFLVLANAT